MTNEIMIVSGLVAGSLLATIGLIRLHVWLKRKRASAELRRYVFYAVAGAYKVSEAAMDTFAQRMRGADKAQLAAIAYAHAPHWVKRMVSPLMFRALVEDVFDEFLEYYESASDTYAQRFQQWVRQNGPDRNISTEEAKRYIE